MIDIRKGTHICIYGGKFNGVKGVFMRVKGKRRRRVVVMLEGIMGISVEVHPDLIEVINDSDCDKFLRDDTKREMMKFPFLVALHK